MGIISWIVLGALAGWLASIIMKTNAEQGAFANIAVGIIGAIIGGFIASTFTDSAGITGFNISSLIISIIGAVILLALLKTFNRSSHHHV